MLYPDSRKGMLPACCGRLTQRWEASLWLAGKQMYLGGFVAEEDAARAYDLAALACKGLTVPTNFAASQYGQSLAEVSGSSRVRRMQLMTPPCIDPVILYFSRGRCWTGFCSCAFQSACMPSHQDSCVHSGCQA